MNDSYINKLVEQARDEWDNGGKHTRGNTFLSAVNFAPVLLSDLTSEHGDVDWIWEGFLAKGHSTLFSALWKSGKSTLIAQLLKAMQEGKELAGKPTRPCKVLVLSEESQSLWARRREELGIDLTAWVISRPVRHRLGYNEWVGLIKRSAEFCKENSVDLVVVDTVSGFWSVQHENDAGEVQSALLALNSLLEGNISVLLVHHFRKSGGDEGTASRGSGVLGSNPDILIEFSRLNATDPNNRQRTLRTYSRFEESPREVVIDLVDGEYITRGTKAEVSKKAKLSYLLSLLLTTPNGMTTKQIVDEWNSEEAEVNKPSQRTVRNYLSELQKSGKVVTTGEIKAGKTSAPLYGRPLNNAGKERPTSTENSPASKACYACRSKTWWKRSDGELVCATCHPPASENVKERIEL